MKQATPARPEARMHTEARSFEFLQWVRLWLRKRVAESREKGVDLLSLLDEGLDISHSGSIGFAPQDVDKAGMGANGREELRVHFMGLQGASSPLPAYLVDPLLRSDDHWDALRDFYKIFENRSYRLLALGLILRSPAIRAELGASDDLQRHLRLLGGCDDAASESRRLGGFSLLVPQGRSRDGMRRFLAQQLDLTAVEVDASGVAWVPNPSVALLGECRLDGSSAIGATVPVGGERLDIKIGPMPWEQYRAWATYPEAAREKVRVLVEDYLPRPMVWEAEAVLDPTGVPPECGRSLGGADSLNQVHLGAFAWLGTEDPQPARLVLN